MELIIIILDLIHHCTTGQWTINTNKWYAIGFSRSGAAIAIYINGAADTFTAGTHIDNITSARTLKIGVYDDKTSLPYDGQMGLWKAFNYALSAGQHAAIFQKERHYFGV